MTINTKGASATNAEPLLKQSHLATATASIEPRNPAGLQSKTSATLLVADHQSMQVWQLELSKSDFENFRMWLASLRCIRPEAA